MASGEANIIWSVLSNDECSKVPEDIREKLESYIKSKDEECVVSKALLETTRANLGKYVRRYGSNLQLWIGCGL